MSFLSKEDNEAIRAAIKKAEAGTSGEIVFAVADASGNYRHANLQGAIIGMAIITAIFLLSPLSHKVPAHYEITVLLGIEFISFAVFYALLPYLPWRRWIISHKEMDARVQESAFMQFYASGLYRTKESNGVEIYLSLFEREVVVIGDRGIHAKMGEQHWNQVRDLIIQGIKGGTGCNGICAAIESCGQALAEHFPHRPDDINELPDQVITRPLNSEAP